MLSRFHTIPERYGQTDGRTYRIPISISRVSMLTRDKKDSKSTSGSLRLNSATVLDDTTHSGIPLKQLTHLLKSHFQTVGYNKTAVLCTHISSVNGIGSH